MLQPAYDSKGTAAERGSLGGSREVMKGDLKPELD